MSLNVDLGPQYAKDDAFTARMRLHQSWYRAERLGLPFGTGPQQRHTSKRGNMLRRRDGERGRNFLTDEIWEFANARQKELPKGIERFRLLCNMLSSQPMCFNLFAPLALEPRLAPRLMSALLDAEVRRVTSVIIEHAPAPASNYLGDRTSFDAYVEFELEDEARGFVGIETKLTEPFSAKAYQLADRPSYRRWVDRDDAPWRPDQRQALDDPKHNQLWRDHMLAHAWAARNDGALGTGALILIRHGADAKCAAALRSYQQCLQEDCTTLLDRPLDDVVQRWRPIVRGTRLAKWLSSFDERYVDLAGSERIWRETVLV